MNFWLLNAITATRLLVCAPLWLWCWWKRPRGMVLWMSLVAAWFLATDHLDGQWAKATRTGSPPANVRPLLDDDAVNAAAGTYQLRSPLGYWLDHLADFCFYGAVVLSVIKGSREPGLRRRLFGRRAAQAATPPEPGREATGPSSTGPDRSPPPLDAPDALRGP